MESYSIVLKPSVEKDLRKLPKTVVALVFEEIEKLPFNPIQPPAKKLTGTERMYRKRVGDYRIIYEIDPGEKVITIHYVRHRRDAYRPI